MEGQPATKFASHVPVRSPTWFQRARHGWRQKMFVAAAIVVAVLAIAGTLALVNGVRQSRVETDELKAMAVQGLPAGATVISGPFVVRDSRRAVVIAVSRLSPAQALAAAPRAGAWEEVPGTRTSQSRSFLSASQSRILSLRAEPCTAGSSTCPSGGSQLQAEALVAGPRVD